MKRISLCAIVVAGFSMMMVGCAKEPVQDVIAAKAAIVSAKAAQADKYLVQEFAAVQDSFKAAEAEIAKQKAASALSRNYDKAKATLAVVVSMGTPLSAKAVEEKAKVQTEADNAVLKLNASISEVKEILKKAPKGKAAKALFETKGKEIAAVESTIGDVQSLEKSGDVIEARDKANVGIATVESIKAELTAEIEKPAQTKAQKAPKVTKAPTAKKKRK
jgi:hypothetical protein